MAKDDDNNPAKVLEQGDIFFLYRPRVDDEHPKGLDDVERFYMVLRPRGGHHVRLMIVGDKKLPDVNDHDRFWGFVEAVSDSGKDIEKGLREEHYDTKTRGERTRPAARPAGEGVYAFIQPDRDMHLVYALELPEELGEVQRAFNIRDKAAYVLSIKNPEKGSPPNVGLSQEDEADYPKKLQKEFEGRRFAPTDPKLLDYEGAEFVLIGATGTPEKDYDVQLDPHDESDGKADIFTKLRMAKSRHPSEPLFEGEWA